MKYPIPVIAVLLVAVVLIAGCAQTTSQPSTTSTPQNVVRIGVIASLTGPASNVGTNMWQSAQVAADKINADGGVTLKDGSKAQIKLVVGDDESTQTGGQKAATKLITDDKVDILVGGYSSAVTSSYQQTIAEYKNPVRRDRRIKSDHHPPYGYRYQLHLPPLPDNRQLRRVYHPVHRPGCPPCSEQETRRSQTAARSGLPCSTRTPRSARGSRRL